VETVIRSCGTDASKKHVQNTTYRFTAVVGAIAGSYNCLEIHSDAATLERVKLDDVLLELRHARTKQKATATRRYR